MNIGTAIQTVRKSKGINQLELAEKVEISQAALSKIESGLKKPGTKTLDKICLVLGTPKALLYILSINDEDIPRSKKIVYDKLFPEIKKSILSIIQE